MTAAYFNVLAEGTKQLSPTANDRVNLAIGYDSDDAFATYNGIADQRLFIRIQNPNDELVYLGFSRPATSSNYPCAGNRMTAYFRIKDPSGNIVFGPQILSAGTSPISSWSQVVNGPNQIVGTGGYDAFAFDPSGLATGDYYIEFSENENNQSGDVNIEWWDITVADRAANTAINGRVFAKLWSFFTPDTDCNGNSSPYGVFDQPFVGSFFAYSASDSIVSRVDFDGSGMQPAYFNVFFNEFGANNTGDVCEDRKSVFDDSALPVQHPVFLNNPDESIYPSGIIGTFASSPFFVSCDGNAAEIYVEVTKRGQVEVLLDFNNSGDNFYTPGTADRVLAFKIEPELGELAPFLRRIPWDGKDGLGSPVDLSLPFNSVITYTQGIFHFPIFDVEYMLTGFTFSTHRPIPPPTANPIRIYYDDTNIPEANGTGAPKLELNGCIAPCHSWDNYDYGNQNTINTWFFGSEERLIANNAVICPVLLSDDFYTIGKGTPAVLDIILNDSISGGDTTSISTVGLLQPMNGTTSTHLPQIGQITYTPAPNFIGIDSFQYLIVDTSGFVRDTAMVFITIINNAPIATNDFDTTFSQTSIEISVLKNDTDFNGDTLTITGVGTDSSDGMTSNGGSVSINDNGTPLDPTDDFVDYAPMSGYVGLDTFFYQIDDGFGGLDRAMVVINVMIPIEDCSDGIDNDLDGLIDCDDPDCGILASEIAGDCNGLSVITTDPTYGYQWYTEPGNIISGEICPDFIPDPLSADVYFVIITNGSGCSLQSNSIRACCSASKLTIGGN